MLKEKCLKAKEAAVILAASEGALRDNALGCMSAALLEKKEYILAENAKDLAAGRAKGLSDALLDRLMLDEKRITAISAAVIKIKALTDPIGKGRIWQRPNGLVIERVQVPLGVIGIIYESRPNVTADAAALCIKSGNCVILRGGSEAINSNIALAQVLRDAVERAGLSAECIQIVENTDRETATELMKLRGYIDLLIPRGGKSLIRTVVENSTVPVIETGAGNCHVFVDASADIPMALEIVYNAKVSRPSVCNAAEGLIVSGEIADLFLPLIREKLSGVELRGCEKTVEIIPGIKKADEEDFYTEYNDYIMSVKVVAGVKEAVAHINKYNTGHSEAIVTKNLENAEYFSRFVDAAAVYVNASTRFTDGEEFGFGAEIGVSTQKMHARGPMGVDELTTVKYKINGNGQIR